MINQGRLAKILDRAKSYNISQPLSLEEINNIEKELEICLPNDFKQLCSKYSYEYFGNFSYYNFLPDTKYSVKNETLDFRSYLKLPHDYIVLAQGDVDILLLKTPTSDNISFVIWCDHEDLDNICKGGSFQYNPTIFPSFADFFEFLLDEEEKARTENVN